MQLLLGRRLRHQGEADRMLCSRRSSCISVVCLASARANTSNLEFSRLPEEIFMAHSLTKNTGASYSVLRR